MSRPALRIEVAKKDQKELEKMLRGGVQPVRSVLRAMALLQLAKGISAPRIAEFIPLTPQAIRKVGHRYIEGGFDRAVYEKERPGAVSLMEDSQKQRINRHGLRRSARGPCPVDRAAGGRASRKTTPGSSGRTRNHSGSAS